MVAIIGDADYIGVHYVDFIVPTLPSLEAKAMRLLSGDHEGFISLKGLSAITPIGVHHVDPSHHP